MSDPFARMNESIFARLGGDVFLRTNEVCQADVHHGVAVSVAGEYGDLTSYRTVVNISYGALPIPRSGDKLTIGPKIYTLDSLIKDDGYSSRWIVV